MGRILVRADDLGYCEAVNYGIAKAVKEGIIRSVGLMPNMEAARHGVELLKGAQVCFGQHTNICNGRPLTDPKRIPSLVQENGEFKDKSEYRKARKDFVVLDEVILEIEAQYQRFVELVGDKPHYLEAHAVPSDNLSRGLQIVAQRHDLQYLGGDGRGPVRFRNTNLYMSMDSMFPDYDPFRSLKNAALRDVGEDGCVMMVCHPGYVDEYVYQTSFITRQRAQEVAMCIAPETKQWLEENHIQVVTYDDL